MTNPYNGAALLVTSNLATGDVTVQPLDTLGAEFLRSRYGSTRALTMTLADRDLFEDKASERNLALRHEEIRHDGSIHIREGAISA
uniref:Uncharacterized protein n=1 Tax=viral metagenome TaxID=1070528 RepID=A0A6M3KSS3_9ZZZZ